MAFKWSESCKKITPFDVALLLVCLSLSVFLVVFLYKTTLEAPESVVITSKGEESIYNIHTNKKIDVEGLLGTTVVEVQNGGVMITSSPCKEKTCSFHPISKNGESLTCLPNGVNVLIKSLSGKGEDIEISF